MYPSIVPDIIMKVEMQLCEKETEQGNKNRACNAIIVSQLEYLLQSKDNHLAQYRVKCTQIISTKAVYAIREVFSLVNCVFVCTREGESRR